MFGLQYTASSWIMFKLVEEEEIAKIKIDRTPKFFNHGVSFVIKFLV